MEALQKAVAAFVAAHGLAASAEVRLLDLTSEVGELAKEVLKGSRYGREPLALGPSWEEELGDVFFAVICLANQTGVDLGAALPKVLAKYEQRMTQKGDAGSGG